MNLCRVKVVSCKVYFSSSENNPGQIALINEPDLEVLLDFDPEENSSKFNRFDEKFLRDIKSAAEKHLQEKNQIRDTIGLLDIYHKYNGVNLPDSNLKRKRKK